MWLDWPHCISNKPIAHFKGEQKMKKLILVVALGALAGCAIAPHSANVYHVRETMNEQSVRMATVESVRDVTLTGGTSDVGAMTGAALGGIAGSTVGGGRGALAATIAGAVVGGVIGQKVEQDANNRKGLEITVRLDQGGDLRAITQEADEQFRAGERVRLVSNGRPYTCPMSSPVLFAIACLIWGSTFWAITLQLGEVPPSVSVVYRFALASAALFAWCNLRGDKPAPALAHPALADAAGLRHVRLSYICTYQAEQVRGLGAGGRAVRADGVLEPDARAHFPRHAAAARTWSAGAVATCGVILLFYQSICRRRDDLQVGGSGQFLLGVVLALVATMASSAGNVVVARCASSPATCC
jgi:outer membrane lipoprotein SlyB